MRCNLSFFMLGLVFLFLLSCKPIEQPEITENITEENMTAPVNQTVGPCISGWKCIGKWDKAYQYENCSWVDRIECPLGCINGTCQAGETCDSGFKCIDENKKGYQLETCGWIKVKTCEWGCNNSACNPMPENLTEEEPTETPVEEEITEETTMTIVFHEKKAVEINGVEYNISIYNIEADRVIIIIDDLKSDWIAERDIFTYANGLTIYVKEILYQPYAGGIQAVNYKIYS